MKVPIIFNSIFQINTAEYGNDIYNSSDTSLIIAYSCLDIDEIGTPWSGENNINDDPELIDETCHVAYSSPCINTGALSVSYFGETYLCPEDDIDGQPRPLNFTADMGVDEVLVTGTDPSFQAENMETTLMVHPNPIHTQTTINYTILESSKVTLQVFNIDGKLQENILTGFQPKGDYTLNWAVKDLDEGMYIIRLVTNKNILTKKLIIK